MLKYFNPLAWMGWCGQFFAAWLSALPWRDTPKALPAIILMVTLSVAGAVAWTDRSNWRSELLDRQFRTALDEEDHEIAELVIKRQLAARPDDPRFLYDLAMIMSAQGMEEEAAELMWELVRVKKHEHAARWLLAELFIGKQWQSLSAKQRDDFGSLLKLLNRESPDDLQVQQLYADYLIATERLALAVPLLERLAPVQPMRGLQAAAISRSLGNDGAANRMATRTLDAVTKLSQEDPTNAMLALAVAQNQLFLQRFPEAVQTLDLARQRAQDPQSANKLKQALGDTMVAWISFVKQSGDQTSAQRLRILQMLQIALDYAPNNPRVLTMVADQVLAAADNEEREVAALREALVEGSSPGIAHFIRGTAALIEEDTEAAMMHLEAAAELLPKSGPILNNLAVAMTSGTDEHLEQALQISEAAIQYAPAVTPPHFYETRGQIRFRLERFREAIPDLERAVSHPDLADAAHQSLAICYAKTGNPELSRLHREAIEKTTDDLEPAESARPKAPTRSAPRDSKARASDQRPE